MNTDEHRKAWRSPDRGATSACAVSCLCVNLCLSVFICGSVFPHRCNDICVRPRPPKLGDDAFLLGDFLVVEAEVAFHEVPVPRVVVEGPPAPIKQLVF